MYDKAWRVVNLQSIWITLNTECNQGYWTFGYFIVTLQTLENSQPGYFRFRAPLRVHKSILWQKSRQGTQWTVLLISCVVCAWIIAYFNVIFFWPSNLLIGRGCLMKCIEKQRIKIYHQNFIKNWKSKFVCFPFL